jgi:hypothetical protein
MYALCGGRSSLDQRYTPVFQCKCRCCSEWLHTQWNRVFEFRSHHWSLFNVKMTAVWNVAPRNVSRPTFRKSVVSIIALIMEALRISETSVYFHEITRRYIPESCCICSRRLENLIFHIFDVNRLSSSLARQPYVGLGLPQKLLPAKVSGYCYFRFRDKSLFRGEVVKGGVVSPTPNPRLFRKANVSSQGCLP